MKTDPGTQEEVYIKKSF